MLGERNITTAILNADTPLAESDAGEAVELFPRIGKCANYRTSRAARMSVLLIDALRFGKIQNASMIRCLAHCIRDG